jgi:hypothetical protein
MNRSADNSHILARDLYGITLVLFIGLVALLDVAEAKSDSEAGDKIPGSISATITWPDGDTDVDLWVDGPGELRPVGYSSKGGLLWNLLRDDLGLQPDFMGANFENAFTRGIPQGEYRVNVQCFRCPVLPVEVKLEVAKSPAGGGKREVIAQSTITLNSNHQEKTGLAFDLDAAGNVVPDSMNTVFGELRSRGVKKHL